MSLILFYTFVSSIVFVYGIGLECIYVYLANPKKLYFVLLKNIVTVFISVSLTWALCRYVLNPLKVHFLLPVLTIVFLEFSNLLIKLVLPKFADLKPEEKIFSWGLVFFCLYQSSSFFECAALIFSAALSLLVFLFILTAIKRKVDANEPFNEWKKASLFLISMGLMLSAFYLTDLSPFFQFF
ncbi:MULTISPECIES: hypothetical protein [unclassified Treponema]|uniref:hypothetical protein n=1 Tax=unclassified Treponema TaxID=2638727 RepID=UPI0020A2B7E8|nr:MULTISPECIES: hypothetical protein [unclassified Treponema]UTC68254.1 hypothetical protein E4O06_06370 [Treponema sp. OMZ 789]UTC70974.1 hypothetical protein E4O01_06515 [Treponema sp. OMZ 790]UTC73714.1 hypothetical protein E4O02_06710 [Treponema sp. OMZ 791]